MSRSLGSSKETVSSFICKPRRINISKSLRDFRGGIFAPKGKKTADH